MGEPSAARVGCQLLKHAAAWCTVSMRITRRALLQAVPASLFAQGMATRNIRPQQRGKRSGLPFDAKFTDVAHQAGLTAPSIYGSIDTKRHILEAVGCGIAFFDYDHDGWLDILVLGGTRFGTTPAGAGNRLYKNNRDGTFQRRHREIRPRASRLGLWRRASAITTTMGWTICSSPITTAMCCSATTATAHLPT